MKALRADKTFDDEDREAADDQRDRDNLGRAEHRLDRVERDEADDDRGHEGDQQVDREAPRARLALEQSGDHRPERAPIEDDDGQDRAQLDDDVEGRPLFGRIAEQLAREDQMAGR